MRRNLIDMEAPGVWGESDSRLVAEARDGNEKAFRKLVERCQPMVFAVVRGVLGEREDVEDVVQDVFVRVYRGLPAFRGDAKLSTWVYTIARNEAVNAGRKRDPRAETIDDVVVETPEDARPDEQYQRKRQREHLGRCLSELDEDFRVALELRYMGEMSYEEISEAMGLPIGTVKTYIHRGKIELKRVLVRKRFVEPYGKRERS
jgi:RNA polymerase sigma-70 factor (ECF subfamily)